MAFTFVEANSASNNADYLSAVRWLIQDTDEATAELADALITAQYGQTDSTESQQIRNFATALACAQGLERRYRKQASFSSGKTSVQLKERAEAWAKSVDELAMELFSLRQNAAGRSGGLISVSRPPLYDDNYLLADV